MDKVQLLGWIFLVFHAVLIPRGALRTRRHLAQHPVPPDLGAHLLRVILSQVLLVTLSLVVAWGTWIRVFMPPRLTWVDAALGAGALALLVAIAQVFWRDTVDRGEPRVAYLSPRTPRERVLWVLVSLAAGIGEEITYRGVLFIVLLRITGNPWAALAVSAAIFTLAHLQQRPAGLAVIALGAVLCQLLAMRTGSLYLSMALHTLYDVIAGFTYARLVARREARRAETAAAATG